MGDTSCDHLTQHLIYWLQFSTVLSSLNTCLVFLTAVLGVLNAFSHGSCFSAVVLARHEETTFDKETDLFSTVEFTSVKKNSIFGSSSKPTGPDLF
jgi:hypothetical protein